MLVKQQVLFFLLIFSHFVMAQKSMFDSQIKEIDSLITYNQFDEAEQKANRLYKLLNEEYSGKEYVEQRTIVRFQQGLIKDSRFDHIEALPILLEVLSIAEKNKLYRIACRANIRIAFNYEKVQNYDLAYDYLNAASKLCKKHKMNDLYSAIFIRYALLHRFMASDKIIPEKKQPLLNKGIKASLDSAIYYTEKTIEYSLKYDNEFELTEGYLTMGILYGKRHFTESTKYFLKTLPFWRKTQNYECVSIMYVNIAYNYLEDNNAEVALKYNDSAYLYYDKVTVYYKLIAPQQRAKIFYALKELDSAYHYQELGYKVEKEKIDLQEVETARRLEEQYQNDKKEATIKSKNRQVILIGSLLGVIFIATVLLVRKNRQINKQNKTINSQVVDLSKTLEQKQILLSELQHRVKNNLQHVISILEIQKESVDFNNIDELIRGNQNRIHSMALLHKKLNVSDNVNDVDLKRYISELSELVKESYNNNKKQISLNIRCEIKKISIEKALPLGLIIVELVSNSMNHAFNKQNIGIITIEITQDQNTNRLYYADNGSGFDFHKTSEKGLGQEIIKGLIDQLDGNTETTSNNGFELTVYFNQD